MKLFEDEATRLDVQMSFKLIISYKPGSKVIKLFSCLTQLSMKFRLLIESKIPGKKTNRGPVAQCP